MKGRTGANIRGVVRIEGIDALIEELRRLGVDVRASLREAGEAGGKVVRDEAQRLAPGPGIGTEVEKATQHDVTVAVGPTKEKWYYRFFELGAQPHEIKGKPLAFEVGGETIVVGRVHHPGLKARPFLRPALDAKGGAAIQTIARVLEEIIRRRGR